MKFTIQRGDVKVEVEADGPDASQLLQQLLAPSSNGHGSLLTSLPTPSATPPVLPKKTPEEREEAERIIALFQDLGDAPRVILSTLLEHPSGLTDLQLKEALAPKNITTLAGSMTAIAKGCTRLGIRRENVLERNPFRDRQRNGTYYRYKIGKSALAVLKAIGPERQRELLGSWDHLS